MTKSKYLKSVNNPLKMSLFLFLKLPGAWFMGVRLKHCDEEKSQVSLPYGWRSQNPFRSIYFAAQSAAAEFSTGILGQVHLQGKPQVSMLIVKFEAEFLKKASQTLTFTCQQGREIETAIQKAVETGQSQSIRTESVATLPGGEVASRFWVTWSFKKYGAAPLRRNT